MNLSLSVLLLSAFLAMVVSSEWRRTAIVILLSSLVCEICNYELNGVSIFGYMISHGVHWIGIVYALIDAMTLIALYAYGKKGAYRIGCVVFAYVPVQLAMTWQVLTKNPGMMYNYYEWFIAAFNIAQAFIFMGGPIYAHIRRIRMVRYLMLGRGASLAHTHVYRGQRQI